MIDKWCSSWQMCVNYGKSVFMSVTHKEKPLQLKYNVENDSLVELSEYKYLGIWITNRLSWTKHIDYVASNTLRKLFFLKRTLKYSTSDTRLLAYKTIIRPILEYGNVIWAIYKINIDKTRKNSEQSH